MPNAGKEFRKRYLLHVLPSGFMKIRYFGFRAHTNKKHAIALIRDLIGATAKLPEKINEIIVEMMLRLTGTGITCCPACSKGRMQLIRELAKQPGHSS